MKRHRHYSNCWVHSIGYVVVMGTRWASVTDVDDELVPNHGSTSIAKRDCSLLVAWKVVQALRNEGLEEGAPQVALWG